MTQQVVSASMLQNIVPTQRCEKTSRSHYHFLSSLFLCLFLLLYVKRQEKELYWDQSIDDVWVSGTN